MSFSMDAPNLQIWDNAVFDDSLFADDPTRRNAWLPLQPITNIPHFPNLNASQEKSSKKPGKQDIFPIDDNIDAEIEDVEKEIRRLHLKLESLRRRKAEMDLMPSTARRGRIVPAKFMEQKPSPASKKIEGSPARLGRRGFSLGPLDIPASAAKSCFQKLEGIKEEKNTPKPRPSMIKAAQPRQGLEAYGFYRKRGLSIGPSEIASSARCHLPYKRQEVEKKEKLQSLTVSPRPRKPRISTLSELRKGVATVGANKSVQKQDSIKGRLKPKNLFQESQNPVSCKKPLKNAKARIVASRYSLSAARNEEVSHKRRKWSLPEPEKLSLSLRESSKESEEQQENGEENGDPLLTASSPPSFFKISAMLPKIRTTRRIAESPRDSGCAKRAAQLVGKKPRFSMEDGQNFRVSPCKFLKFEEQNKLLN